MSRGADGYEKTISDCGPDGPMCWLPTCERCKVDAATWAAPRMKHMEKLTARIKANHMADHGLKTKKDTALRAFIGCSLLVRHDPDTARWVVALVSRTGREDVPVAWKATEEDATVWAANYGIRK